MADLTNLLGNAYSRPAGSHVPEWSDDDRLDAAFGSWEPGPGPEASATEKAMFVSAARQVAVAVPVADLPYADSAPMSAASTWSSLHETEAVAEESTVEEAAESHLETEPVSSTIWRREDCDVLAGRSGPSLPSLRAVRLRLRRSA